MKVSKRILTLLLGMIMIFSSACASREVNETGNQDAATQNESNENLDSAVVEVDQEDDTYLEEYEYGDWVSYDEDGELIKDNRNAVGQNGVVSSQRYEASSIGVEIMKNGGNAIDAAVATAFALGVCEPNASGLGGGGFMTFRDAKTGEIHFIDFREVAPLNATADMYPLDENQEVIGDVKIRGGLSVAVPGEVAGLLYILDNYGTMSRQEVIQPAIDLANEGFLITPMMETVFSDAFKLMTDYPELGKIYLDEGLPYGSKKIIKNPDLAKTLGIIAEKGIEGFYEGEVAEAIIKSSEKYGGILTKEDLENYKIEVVEPVRGTYRGYEIVSSPPPSSGGTHLIQIMNMLENFDIASMKPYSAEYMHLFSESFKIAYADRAKYMGDPNYVEVPISGLMNKEYAKTLANKIDMSKSNVYEADDPWKYEGNSTTHLSVADIEGNMVGITKTINYYFGSGIVVDGYGFILNNEMDDFSPIPGEANSVAPGKKPLSSMSPTIVLKEDKPFLVLGAPGGSSIFAQIAQVLSHVIDHDMEIQAAIDMPRIWDNTSNKLIYMDGIDEAEVNKLIEMGHEVSHYVDDTFGYVQAIEYSGENELHGGADYYTDSKAVGF